MSLHAIEHVVDRGDHVCLPWRGGLGMLICSAVSEEAYVRHATAVSGARNTTLAETACSENCMQDVRCIWLQLLSTGACG